MTEFNIIRTLPGTENYMLFEKVVTLLYNSKGPRFIYGNDPASLFLEGCYVLLKKGEPVGRFSLYENPLLSYLDKKACCLGSYECEDDFKTSNLLLQKAKELAIARGYSWIIGPMEGSTWNSYRFSLNHDSPNFFLEPYHHVYYNDQFLDAGFNVIKTYVSQLLNSNDRNYEKVKTIEEKNATEGFTIRNINIKLYEKELVKIAQLSMKGFSSNFLYTQISQEDFIAKYLPVKSYLDPELVLLIENKNNQLEAFIFCIPDHLDKNNKTLIVKSIVKHKQSSFYKLGEYTTHKIKEIAQKKGFTKIIHAFMASDNISAKISEQNNSKNYKEYALYGFKL